MLENWDSQDSHLLPRAQEHNARSRRSSTSVRSWRAESSDVDITMDMSTDASQAVIGGIPSDDDEVEHQEVATRVMNKSGASGVRFRVSANFHLLKLIIGYIYLVHRSR
jgi:hypothetical protein